MFHALVLSVHADHGALHRATHRDQLKRLKVTVCTAAGALEGLLDAQAGRAHAVGDVDYARKFLELPEELLRYQAVVAGVVHERLLWRIVTAARSGGKDDKTVQDEAEDGGHGGSLSHSPRRQALLIAVERQ